MKKRKNHSPEFRAKVALEAIRDEMTLAVSGCAPRPAFDARNRLGREQPDETRPGQ